jgi:biotin carboxyl carrier protein
VNRFRITIGNRSYDVQVGNPQQFPLTVIVDGETFHVDVQALQDTDAAPAVPKEPSTPALAGVVGEGPPQVTAPMPGTILDIAAQVGERVQQGQVLCALEAMKMKSPIRAPRAGTVRQAEVTEGQTVDYGDLLFVVD